MKFVLFISIQLFYYIQNYCGDSEEEPLTLKPEDCFDRELDEESKSKGAVCCIFKLHYMSSSTYSSCIAIKREEKQQLIDMEMEVENSPSSIICEGDEYIDADTGKCSLSFPYSADSCYKRKLADSEKKTDGYGYVPDSCCFSQVVYPNFGTIENCIPVKKSEINSYIEKMKNNGLNNPVLTCSDSENLNTGKNSIQNLKLNIIRLLIILIINLF